MTKPPSGSNPSPDLLAAWAIRDAVPTRAHAEMLFDQVVDLLSERAWIESWNEGTTRTLFCREPGRSWIVPWPLLTVSRGGREGPDPEPTGIPGLYAEPKRRPGRAPRLRGLGPGELTVHDGPHRVTIAYGKDGRWFECMRSASPETFEGVVDFLARRTAAPVERLAAYLAERDLGRHGPGRVHLPIPLPAGIEGTWRLGLCGARRRLFHEPVPQGARWLLIDGWTGTAHAFGTTLDQATDAWRREVERVRPFPAPTRVEEPPPGFLPEGFALLRGPSSDREPVEPAVENTPCVAIPIDEPPSAPPPVGAWVFLVGAHGSMMRAALVHEPEGFTLVGDRLLDGLDFADLDVRLAKADLDAPARPEVPEGLTFPLPKRDCRLRFYQLFEERSGLPSSPTVLSCSWTERFDPAGLDGDALRWRVVRQRFEC